MAEYSINGTRYYYEIHGKGRPLLLIAGLASDSQSWQPVIEDLSRSFMVITPDNRGCGRTKPMDQSFSIKEAADDYAVLIDELALSSVDILGHSMGGFIALQIATGLER